MSADSPSQALAELFAAIRTADGAGFIARIEEQSFASHCAHWHPKCQLAASMRPTVAQYRTGDPHMPDHVAEYHVARIQRRWEERLPLLLAEWGVEGEEELAALPFETVVEHALRGMPLEMRQEAACEVLGEVTETAERVHVVYRPVFGTSGATWNATMATCALAGGGWRVITRTGELLEWFGLPQGAGIFLGSSSDPSAA